MKIYPTIFLTALFLLLLLIVTLFYHNPFLSTSLSWSTPPPPPPPPLLNLTTTKSKMRCDIFHGDWVPKPSAPYYTNQTCHLIHRNQNCMKFGRPDFEYMKWRWKPEGCDLGVFDPEEFLGVVTGKSIGFLGDSVGRNHMQSLICLLSTVTTHPIDVSDKSDEKFPRWYFPAYKLTVAYFWSPMLIKAQEADHNGPKISGLFNLYLDEPDPNWSTKIEGYDYIIVSAGHWFFRPAKFYFQNKLVGCYYCNDRNVPNKTMYFGYRHAFRTTFKVLFDSRRYRGTTFLRTFAPQHFENGMWNTGGDCIRRRPFRRNETSLEGFTLELYKTQLEEFLTAKKDAVGKGRKMELLDVTGMMWLRPDGHPSRYGHLPDADEPMPVDCVHWCLPGPIDDLNGLLLEMLKRERVKG